MQKKHLFIVSFILLSGITYLFYTSGKRDTTVITPAVQLSIPDSSWLYGTFNLEQIRQDIALSSLLNGDISKLFQADTNSNILLKIFRSPSDFSITDQNNIRYFSIWKNNIMYNGLLFNIEDNRQLQENFKSDSLTLQKIIVFSFRTREGYWLYNNRHLLFIAKQQQDSLVAQNIFSQPAQSLQLVANDSIYLSCTINTRFYLDSIPHPFLDSSLIQIAIKANTDNIDIDWNYKGTAVNYFNQVRIPGPAKDDGLYAACSPTPAALDELLNVYTTTCTGSQKMSVDLHPFMSILENNTLTVEFDGWNKLLQSFYRYELNEEFETVMVKKDSLYLEPTFRITLANAGQKEITNFITYLHQAGLISKNKKPPFKTTLGNFDSELNISKDSSLIFQNSHPAAAKQSDKINNCIFYLSCKPNNIQGLFDQKEFKERKEIATIAELNIAGYKTENELHGSIKASFNEDKHPLLSVIELMKK
ncbi:MAG: hypothetical protein ACTHJT_12340 [Cytophaga sp.]|uniref:hypothetical protein n=1 Tax=Cytophaga sp. TaxID=29535 RepID=UPI003F81A700